MPRKARDVTDAELAILQLLWENPAATIREITDRLYPDGDAAAYGTVKKLLARLEAKGCVIRDDAEKVHRFQANVQRDDLVGRRLQDVVDSLCDGSWTPLLTHLVNADGLSKKQQKTLESLIDELEGDVVKGGK